MSERLMIAVCGGREIEIKPEYANAGRLAQTIGRHLAQAGRFDIVFGACPGYADCVARSFLDAQVEGTRIIGLSPWHNEEEHRSSGYPHHQGVEYRFTGTRSRSSHIIYGSDAAIFFPGETGTKNEFSLATHSSLPALIAGRAFEKILRAWMERGLTPDQRKKSQVEVFEDIARLLELLGNLSPVEKPGWCQL